MLNSKFAKAAAVAVTMALSAGGATAATFDGKFVFETAGNPTTQIFDLGGGELLAALGVTGAETGDEFSVSILQGFAASGSVTGLFGGVNGDLLDPDTAMFDRITGTVALDGVNRASDGRAFETFFVSFTGGGQNGLVLNTGFRGTATSGTIVTQPGNPLADAPSPVPLPAALPLLLAGLGGMGLLARRDRLRA